MLDIRDIYDCRWRQVRGLRTMTTSSWIVSHRYIYKDSSICLTYVTYTYGDSFRYICDVYINIYTYTYVYMYIYVWLIHMFDIRVTYMTADDDKFVDFDCRWWWIHGEKNHSYKWAIVAYTRTHPYVWPTWHLWLQMMTSWWILTADDDEFMENKMGFEHPADAQKLKNNHAWMSHCHTYGDSFRYICDVCINIYTYICI